MTMIKQAAIYYSASTVYELFHLESAMAFCFEAKLHMPSVGGSTQIFYSSELQHHNLKIVL